MTETNAAVEPARLRVDQWLWYARLAKSRSLAARLCAAGAIAVNGAPALKASRSVRIGDIVALPQGGWRRSVRVLGLGVRRGPAAEAQLLYEEAAAAQRLRDSAPPWAPLLAEEDTPPV